MNCEPYTYQDERISANLVVHAATIRIGLRRTMLSLGADHETDPERRLLRMYSYADAGSCTTGTITIDGQETAWPPEFDVYLGLPDRLGAGLEAIVYRMNPHWLPGHDDGEEKKRQTGSTAG